MSDETPTPDAAVPPAASTPTPEPPAAPAATPTPEPAPVVETPAPAPVAETPAAAAAPTEPEIPVAAAAPTEPMAPAAPAAAPVAPVAPVAAAPAPSSSSHVAVPKWILVSIAAVIGALVMFGIGYAVGDGSSSDNTAVATPFGGQNNPFGNQNGNGNGTQQNPFGNGNPNGNGTQQNPQLPQSPQAPSAPNQTTSGGFLGVATQQTSNGVEITQVVSGSAADDAGLEVGDVIVEFDGDAVTTPAQLGNAVSNRDAGDSVEVTYERNGQSRTVTVELGTRSATSN